MLNFDLKSDSSCKTHVRKPPQHFPKPSRFYFFVKLVEGLIRNYKVRNTAPDFLGFPNAFLLSMAFPWDFLVLPRFPCLTISSSRPWPNHMTASKKIRTILGRNQDETRNYCKHNVQIETPLILVQGVALCTCNHMFYLDLIFVVVSTFVRFLPKRILTCWKPSYNTLYTIFKPISTYVRSKKLKPDNSKSKDVLGISDVVLGY